MRYGIREHLINNVEWINNDNIFEPHVPNKETPKPFVVIEQLADSEQIQGAIGSERKVNLWLYQDRTSFNELDRMQQDIIKAINYRPVTDKTTEESFTCIYKGVSGSDITDVDWDLIARPLSFSIIALTKTDNYTADREVETVSRYLEKILENSKGVKINVYRDNWNQNLTVPSVLVRTEKTVRTPVVNGLYQIDKTLKIHVVDMDNDMIIHIMEHIENRMMTDEEIIYNRNGRKYKLTLARLYEDRDNDMFTLGQISSTFRYYARPNRTEGVYNLIADDKGLKIRERGKNGN